MSNGLPSSPACTWKSDLLKYIRKLKMVYELNQLKEKPDKVLSRVIHSQIQDECVNLKSVKEVIANTGDLSPICSVGSYTTEWRLYNRIKDLDALISSNLPSTIATTGHLERITKERDKKTSYVLRYLGRLAGGKDV